MRAAPGPVPAEVLLHPHPACGLHPPKLLVLLVHHQFVQLHIDLQPHGPELACHRAQGRAVGRLAAQGPVGTGQTLRGVCRRPRALERWGQIRSSEGRRRSSLECA